MSVGNPELREEISKQIARDIFNKSMTAFVQGRHRQTLLYILRKHTLQKVEIGRYTEPAQVLKLVNHFETDMYANAAVPKREEFRVV